MIKKTTLISLHLFLAVKVLSASTYYIHPEQGNDNNDGSSVTSPWQTFKNIPRLSLKAGDTIALASGTITKGGLVLKDIRGSQNHPLVVTAYHSSSNVKDSLAIIDAGGFDHGIYLENSSGVLIKGIQITAAGGTSPKGGAKMRCGILVQVNSPGDYANIVLDDIRIEDIFFEEAGFKRPKKEVKSANGTQSYGWGIRFISEKDSASITGVTIKNSTIKNVGHTGIKFTGRKNIHDIEVCNNTVLDTGGPGIQFSGVSKVHVHDNLVNGSGSSDDSRKWGRGSGLWTWNSSDVLIEKNEFMNANGPGDSAGVHIDFYCSDVVVQYNLSLNNAGGFCEILGDNFNCSYRYNLSINDGYRIKGVNGAFQEGKIFWLSGYRGNQERRGPFNSYFYNNTIYVKKEIVAKIAIDSKSKGILIANNIFYIEGDIKTVKGDQYKPEDLLENPIDDVVFTNNLFLKPNSWPTNSIIQPTNSIIGEPGFQNKRGETFKDFVPTRSVIRDKGMVIRRIPGDSVGLKFGMEVTRDILGNPIIGLPDIGAIEMQQ